MHYWQIENSKRVHRALGKGIKRQGKRKERESNRGQKKGVRERRGRDEGKKEHVGPKEERKKGDSDDANANAE